MDASNPQPTAKKPQRIKRPVSPEIAANVREENESLAATIAAAKSVAEAAVATANAQIAAAQAKYSAAIRPILRQLGVDDAAIVGTEGRGDSTVVILEIPEVSDA